MDACAAGGGGTVVVPPGRYRCGTVELKSRVTLHLEAGAVIAGSPDPADYRKLLPGDNYHVGNPRQPHNRDQALIVARKATGVGVTGPGAIDAGGHAFYGKQATESRGRLPVGPWRPGPTLLFLDCGDVRLADFAVRDAPFFAVNLVGCTAVQARGLRLTSDFRFQNSDGIHVSCCRGVTVSDCLIDTEDDCLAFFVHHDGVSAAPAECSGVAVSNCVLSSGCTGYTGDGVLRDMAFSNLVVTKAANGIDFLATVRNGYKGETCAAGSSVRDVAFSNVVIRDADFGITANTFDAKPPGGVRDLLFAGLRVASRRGNYLCGNPAAPVQGVVFRDSDFAVTGRLDKRPDKLPDPLPLFGSRTFLPHGFVVRHAAGVAFRDCRLRWDGAAGDWGSALHVAGGRDIDCRTLRADPFAAGRQAITTADAEVRLPATGPRE